ncbi:MAG: dTDP-4-dehydrorhamnose reductase [Gammaproteobacteria bacterium SG8_11]|jgi:dTDP-4-dehydrorhamnose reductase|nr:MAG: dTDP-4-dehydrorhamnose reductase [Gammaproteobacteria bacterium SG8_11]
MRIMLSGANGQVGWELSRSLLPLGEVVALTRAQCDLSRPDTLSNIVQEIKPDVIVNAAAYTAVDKAEEEEELATVINGTAVGVLAEEAKKHNALFIHYSTDYVFDGKKSEPYTEDDIPNPINAYGRSKLIGEQAIQQVGCDYLILRTTWVYAARGKNFLKTMLRLAQERNELRIVADQYGAPTWARNIADVTAQVLATAKRERLVGEFTSGTYHLSASGKTTWHDFSSAIIERVKQVALVSSIKTERVLPITTEDYPLPAARPKNSQMDSSSLTARFGVTMPEWQHAMELCIDEVFRIQ